MLEINLLSKYNIKNILSGLKEYLNEENKELLSKRLMSNAIGYFLDLGYIYDYMIL